jgi:TolB-like protein/Flp pilus assembly protein TadD
MRLFSELRRRNVLRMAALYLVAAWLVMQVAEVLMTLAALPDWVGPLVLALLAVGFPIALILSWFYELTPEGISLDKAAEAPAAAFSHRRVDVIIIALLSAALLMFAYDKWWPGEQAGRSVAVLAFENLSGDPEQEYFSDGIAEELLNTLAQLPGLRVISRSSAFSFKGKDIAVPEMAALLGVGHIVEGSVRRAGDRVRIRAQLIDARSDSPVWSQSFDRRLDDIFEVQDELSAAIAGALREQLGLENIDAAPRAAKVDAEAHEAYLRGRYLVAQRTAASRVAIGEFTRAIELEPDYALAHAELAMAILLFDGRTAAALRNATRHAERAMALDAELAEAHAAAGLLREMQEDFGGAAGDFERAIEIRPNYATAHVWLAGSLRNLGRFREAGELIEQGLRLDPLSKVAINNYVGAMILRNRLADAHHQVEKIAEVYPALYADLKGALAGARGRWADSALANLRASQIDAGHYFTGTTNFISLLAMIGLDRDATALAVTHIHRAWVAYYLGNVKESLRIQQGLVAAYPNDPFMRQELGRVYAAAGDFASAQPVLEAAWERSGGRIGVAGFFPDSAFALVALRRGAGDDTGAAEVLAALQDYARCLREAGLTGSSPNESPLFEQGLTAYLAGDTQLGLALIAQATDDGYYLVPGQAYLQPLYEDPGFAPILADQRARQDRERERLLAVVCNDNPYADAWAPLPATCEAFAQ